MFNFRLPKADADALRMVAKVYGAPNPSAFLREMVGAVISGEPKKTGDFLSKLMVKMGEQLAFEFAQKATKHAGQQVQRALKSPKATGRMKGRRHAA
jgi:protein required for attachment to host cells